MCPKETKLQISMAEVKKDIEYIKEKIDANVSEHHEMREMIKGFIASAEKKYAPMWTATALKLVISTVFVLIIGASMTLILQ